MWSIKLHGIRTNQWQILICVTAENTVYIRVDLVNCDCKENLTDCCCSGDGDRANEQPGLTSLHTVFVRLHNNFEREIAKLRVTSSWSGERLYQETRRIVIGVYQSILFNEFMPLVLGVDTFRRLFGNIGSFDDGRGMCR